MIIERSPKTVVNLSDSPNYRAQKEPFRFIDSVKRIANDIFRKGAEFIYFPLRYLGSKTWSIPGIILRTPAMFFRKIIYHVPMTKSEFFGTGYHFDQGQKLSPEDTKEVLRYAAIGLVPFRYEEKKWAAPFGVKVVAPACLNIDLKKIPGNLQAHKMAFIDKGNTFKAMILEDDNELVVTFGPMHSHWTDVSCPKEGKRMFYRQLKSVFSNYIGGVPTLFKQADSLVQQLKVIAKEKNKRIVVTGQSLAGAIASYVSLKLGVKAVCFNSVQLGTGLQRSIGDAKLAKADALLTHISVKNDLVNNLPGLTALNALFSFIAGLRTPGNFGKRYWIPSAFKSMRDAHDLPIQGLMKYIGYSKESKASDLKTKDIKTSKIYTHSLLEHCYWSAQQE